MAAELIIEKQKRCKKINLKSKNNNAASDAHPLSGAHPHQGRGLFRWRTLPPRPVRRDSRCHLTATGQKVTDVRTSLALAVQREGIPGAVWQLASAQAQRCSPRASRKAFTESIASTEHQRVPMAAPSRPEEEPTLIAFPGRLVPERLGDVPGATRDAGSNAETNLHAAALALPTRTPPRCGPGLHTVRE